MRKGFMHLVEIVIVSIVVFVLIFQFYGMPKQQIDWEGMRLSTQANDMLFSLDRKGVDWFSLAQVNASFYPILSKNMIYTLRLRNAIRPQINVSCICNNSEFAWVQSALQPFQINGRTTSFAVTQVSPDDISFSHIYDVALVFDYNMTNNYTQISQFLQAGKGIVEVRNLQSGEMDSVQADFFGLEWNGTISMNSDPVGFRSGQGSEPYYNIFNYFHSIPLLYDDFNDGNDNGWSRATGAAGWSVSSQYYSGRNTTGNNNWSTSFYTSGMNDSYSLKASFMTDAGGSYNHNISLMMYYNSTNRVIINLDVDADRVSVSENGQGRGAAAFTMLNGTWYRTDVVNENNILKVYLNGVLALTSQPLASIPVSSQVGLSVEYGSARFDDVRVTFSRSHNFTWLSQAGKIQPSGDYRKSILLQRSSGGSACVVNSVSGEGGRTAWLAPGTLSMETQTMLKALLAWAAGEEYSVVEGGLKNAPVVTSFYKAYDQDMFQPVQIVLSMGYAYK